MFKLNTITITALFLIFFSLFFSILLIDAQVFNSAVFGTFSLVMNEFIFRSFGNFSYLMISLFLFIGIMMIFPENFIEKTFIISGYFLLIIFIPPFVKSTHISSLNCGFYGLKVSNFIMRAGVLPGYFVYFFWFFLAIFFMIYPFKDILVVSVIKLFIKARQINVISRPDRLLDYRTKSRTKNRTSVKSENRDRQFEFPWISKVVFENPENKLEIPVVPKDSHEVKKFKLVRLENGDMEYDLIEGNNAPSFDEPPVVSEPPADKQVNAFNDEQNYFNKLKENWPEKWQAGRSVPVDQTETVHDDADTLVEGESSKGMIVADDREFSGNDNDTIVKNDAAEQLAADYNRVREVELLAAEDVETIEEVETVDDDFHVADTIEEVHAPPISSDDVYLNMISPPHNQAVIDTLHDDEEPAEYNKISEADIENIGVLKNNFNAGMPVAFDNDTGKAEDAAVITGDDVHVLPESDILNSFKKRDKSYYIAEQREAAEILELTLKEFGITAEVSDIIHGPVVTLYKLIPAPGIKLQKIEGLSNNLALRLAAKSIRIIAPIPGEKVVGIEIPNKDRELIAFKEIVNSNVFNSSKFHIPIGLGKDIYGNIIVIDLYKMPHLLIAGATGAGKSVCVNSIISSILFSKNPDEVKLMLIDPKIVELKPYNNIPHLLAPVITEPKKALNALKFLVYEMERRYSLLDEMGARDIVEYTERRKRKLSTLEELPFIVAIVDEFADLMSASGKEVEMLFARLAAKARAIGIHLLLATQRPSTDVITGLIKANIPARIAFQVISVMNSRIILDQKGADKLLGQGDMLYLSPSQPFPIRIQGAFLSKDEVDLIAEHWKCIAQPEYINIDEFLQEVEEVDNVDVSDVGNDPLFDEALEVVYQSGKASASYLQRRLSIGYNRAARIIEEMEQKGIVGPARGAKPREILINNLP